MDERTRTLWPPIGLAYLATAVRRDGHQAFILDCARDLRSEDDIKFYLLNHNPDIVGLNVYTVTLRQCRRLASIVRTAIPSARLVLGGPHVSALPEKTLDSIPEADFAIRGEGEVPLRKLLASLSTGENVFDTVPGLIYRRNNTLRINDPYFAPDVTEYGIPAYDLINPSSYWSLRGMKKGQFPVFFSRGCPFPCTFCAAKVTSGQQLRRRSFESIFDELGLLQNKYQVNNFIVYDEGFGTAKSFIMQFCERLKREGFTASFEMGTGIRLDQVDEELLTTIRQAGFNTMIALGIESGSERILKLMKKRTSLQLIREKVLLMRKMGFKPCGYFILGYPTETREEMEATIRLALELPLQEASFTAFMPLPGTEATRWLMENGELPPDFDFSSVTAGSITYAPRGITLEELQSIRRRANLRFYLRPRIILPMLNSVRQIKYVISRFVAMFLRDRTCQTTRG